MGFGGVLWVLSAAVGRKCPAGGNNRGMRIATASVRTGFAMTDLITAKAEPFRTPLLLKKGDKE